MRNSVLVLPHLSYLSQLSDAYPFIVCIDTHTRKPATWRSLTFLSSPLRVVVEDALQSRRLLWSRELRLIHSCTSYGFQTDNSKLTQPFYSKTDMKVESFFLLPTFYSLSIYAYSVLSFIDLITVLWPPIHSRDSHHFATLC